MKKLWRLIAIVGLLLSTLFPLMLPDWWLLWGFDYWILLPISFLALCIYFWRRKQQWPVFLPAIICGVMLAVPGLYFYSKLEGVFIVSTLLFIQGSWASLGLFYCFRCPMSRRLGAALGLAAGIVLVRYLVTSGLLLKHNWISPRDNENNYFFYTQISTILPFCGMFIGSQVGVLIMELMELQTFTIDA